MLLGSVHASAAIYYVRTGGNNNCDGLVNADGASGACAWATIQKAATTLVDGDTVRVQAGEYAEAVAPSVGGTLADPITFVADGVVTVCSITLGTGDDYLRFIGFVIDTDAGCVKTNRAVNFTNGQTVTGVELWNNTIRDATYTGVNAGDLDTRMHKLIAIGNAFTAITGDVSAGGVAMSAQGDDMFIGYNSVTGVDPDIFFPYGNDGWWVNNYALTSISGTRHGDILQNDSSRIGFSRNVFEGNFFAGESIAADEHGVLFQDLNAASRCPGTCAAMTDNVLRRNVWHNFSNPNSYADSSAETGILNTRSYNETFVDITTLSGSAPYAGLIRNINGATSLIVNTGYYFNNLHNDTWTPAISTNIQIFSISNSPWAAWTAADYNLAYKTGSTVTFAANWTNQTAEQSNVDPVFVNKSSNDFTLQVTSGAIGNAGPLTTTSGGGTGTVFNVVAGGGGFFRGPNTDIARYGGYLTEGDVLTVGTDVVTVVSVSTDAITVTPSFTWVDADPVYYGNDTTPDIGAYPYRAGGYTLSATYSGSGARTIVPNDAALVRFVVCYDDNVPYAVDNTSPYSCAAPTGAFTARAYPRYASTSLWAEASQSLQSGPVRIRISGEQQ